MVMLNISKESTGVADDDGGIATPAKRRPRAKGKNGNKKAIVSYDSHPPKYAGINNIKKVKKEDINNVEPVTPTSKPVTPISTPVKRSLSLESQVSPTAALKRVPAETKHGAKTLESSGAAYAPITPKSNGTGEGPIDGNTVITPTVRKRKRSVPTSAPAIAISTSLDTVTPEDKMLLKMRDDGENWSAIRAAWKDMTGIQPGASTLPNRYNRLKANLTVLKEGDVCAFLIFPFSSAPASISIYINPLIPLTYFHKPLHLVLLNSHLPIPNQQTTNKPSTTTGRSSKSRQRRSRNMVPTPKSSLSR